ncbi:MAG: hypothetical protein JW700_03420 [Candidatus Aenigmarchaeota archaeon]|nr:hypothetical protein [Candidatus Aenigmarchaeota archaeon]
MPEIVDAHDGYVVVANGKRLKLWKEPTREEELSSAEQRAFDIYAANLARNMGVMLPEKGKTSSDYKPKSTQEEIINALTEYEILPDDIEKILGKFEDGWKDFS